MILKQEKIIPEIHRELPEIGEPYKPSSKEKTFYEYDEKLNSAVAGYRTGEYNSYVDYLMHISGPDGSTSYESFLLDNKEKIKVKRKNS